MKEKADPVLEAYWTWLNTISRPTDKLKDTITYAQNQKARLCAFLGHGEIEISNNQVENAIRLAVCYDQPKHRNLKHMNKDDIIK